MFDFACLFVCLFLFFVCLFAVVVVFKVTMQGSEARVSCSGSAMRQGTHEYRQFSMILAKSLCGNPCTFTQPKTKFSPLGMICNISRQAFILWWHLNTFCSNFGSSLTQSWAKNSLLQRQNKNTLSDFILPLQMHVQNHERVQNFWFYPFRKKLKENPAGKSYFLLTKLWMSICKDKPAMTQ